MKPSPAGTLTRRALSRATLARQMLLAREETGALDAVERLVALQAQLARPPHIALWSRLAGFQREDLNRLLLSKNVVRATFLRGTLHLLTRQDFAAFRAVLQPSLTSGLRVLGKRAEGLDLERLAAAGRTFFAEKPQSFEAMREVLAQADPGGDERAMGYAVRLQVPLVQVPADTTWGYPASADFILAETWLGGPLGTSPEPQDLVLRYLAAYGPASFTDAQTWTGMRGLRETFEALRPRLLSFRDERKRELFDLPEAPRPPEDTPAPVRFLPEFDSLVLAHDDRTRVVADEHRPAIFKPNLRILPTVLVDGFVAATWKIERKRAAAALVIEPLTRLTKAVRAELTEEGEALARFVEEDARAFEVRFEEG
jgi:hypothetical protein